MSSPQISVIVPVYKVEAYLNRCVESIFNQTFKDYELILVDDASPDNCGQMCDDYAKNDDRVRVIHLTKNVGLSGARNAGLEVAVGEYISFIDSDDWVEQNFLEVLFKKAQADSCEIVACKVIRTDGQIEITPSPAVDEVVMDGVDALRNIFVYPNQSIQHTAWNKLYHRQLFSDGIRYPNGLLHEDVLTTFKLIAKSNRVGYTESTHYYYYQRQDSITKGEFNLERLKAVDEVRRVDTQLKQMGIELTNEVDFFEYIFAVYLIDSMTNSDHEHRQARNKLLQQLHKKHPTLSKKPYFSRLQVISLYLMRWPWVYDLARWVRSQSTLAN